MREMWTNLALHHHWVSYVAEILALVLEESVLSGNITNEYVYFGGQRIARRDAGNNVYYYVEDMLGTSRVITQANGTVCGVHPERSRRNADFYPFGGGSEPSTKADFAGS
jgi:hypothetical protein